MTIGGSDPIPPGHFGGGAHLASNDEDGLRQILNRMKEVAARNYAQIGLGSSHSADPGEHVQWNLLAESGGLVSISTGTGQQLGIVTLAADHTYRITVALDVVHDSAARSIWRIHDRTQDALLVTDNGAEPKLRCVSSSDGSTYGGMTSHSCVFTASVATDFDVRVEAVSGGGTVDSVFTYSWLAIDVLS